MFGEFRLSGIYDPSEYALEVVWNRGGIENGFDAAQLNVLTGNEMAVRAACAYQFELDAAKVGRALTDGLEVDEDAIRRYYEKGSDHAGSVALFRLKKQIGQWFNVKPDAITDIIQSERIVDFSFISLGTE